MSTDIVKWVPQAGSQVLFMTCPIFECLYEGTRGPGKAQSVNAKVMTPEGERRIGDLEIGDTILGSNGAPQKVTGVFPQGVKSLYTVYFSDGTETEACDEHLWQTAATGSGRRWSNRVLTTTEISEWMRKGKRISIPIMTEPAQFDNRVQAMEPYLMGLYLGDGCSVKYSFAISTNDEETKIYLAELGFKQNTANYNWVGRSEHRRQLREYNLEGLTSKDKFIPEDYLYGDERQRWSVLQGLMDSDGSAKKGKNQLRFGSISKQLAEGVAFLIRSLGGLAHIYETQRPKEDRPEYEVTGYLNDMERAFRLTRKKELVSERDIHSSGSRIKKYIDSIQYRVEVEQVCIKVSNENHLYLTNDFIVTHNTDGLLMNFAQYTGMGFGIAWRGIIFRRTYPELQDIITKSKKWFRLIFPEAKYNEAKHEWTWPDGEALLFRHMKTPDDYWSYHGHEYPFMGWEELTNWADDVCYKLMMSCCRSAHPGITVKGKHMPIPRIVRATTNPYGPGHNWVKMRWKLPAGRGIVIDDSYDADGNLEPPRVAIHGSIYENKILLESDPTYITKIAAAARNASERAAWLEGSWDVVAGGMFDDVWKPSVNVLNATRIPSSWRFHRSFDWGSSKPFSVGWWAVSDGTTLTLANGQHLPTVPGDMFRIAEYYGCVDGKPNTGLRYTAQQVAKELIKREKQLGIYGLVEDGVADSAIFNEENRNCIATDMEKEGVFWEKADKRPGSRKQGWETLRQVLKNAHPNSDGYPREEPGLFIFDTCVDFIRTVPSLPRDDKDLDDVDTNAEDHISDETRYFVRRTETEMTDDDF